MKKSNYRQTPKRVLKTNTKTANRLAKNGGASYTW